MSLQTKLKMFKITNNVKDKQLQELQQRLKNSELEIKNSLMLLIRIGNRNSSQGDNKNIGEHSSETAVRIGPSISRQIVSTS